VCKQRLFHVEILPLEGGDATYLHPGNKVKFRNDGRYVTELEVWVSSSVNVEVLSSVSGHKKWAALFFNIKKIILLSRKLNSKPST